MRRIIGICIAAALLAANVAPACAQGPGGAPGMPMQRLGGGRPGAGAGVGAGVGTPGMPMQPMGRTGGGFSTAAPARRNYSGMAGVGGVMSSQSFRASNLAGQARGAGVQRSSAGVVSGVTRGALSGPSSPR